MKVSCTASAVERINREARKQGSKQQGRLVWAVLFFTSFKEEGEKVREEVLILAGFSSIAMQSVSPVFASGSVVSVQLKDANAAAQTLTRRHPRAQTHTHTHIH